MVKGNVLLNAVGYQMVPFELDGQTRLVHRYKVDPFVPGFSEGGPTRLQNLRSVIALTFPNFALGLGRDRIDSDSAFRPSEYRRFYDATADTRFNRQWYIPILEEDSTETGLEVIRASAPFKANLWASWEDGTSTQVLARKYDATAWAAGGRILTIPAFDAATTSASDSFAHVTTTRADRHMLLSFLGGTAPSSITYGGVAMSSITSGTVGSDTLAIWELAAPATGSNTIVMTGESGIEQVSVVTYSNVDQSTPTETAISASGTSTAPSVNVTTAGGRLVFDAVGANGAGSATAGTDQVDRANVASGGLRLANSEKGGAAATTTMSWTLASSVAWRMVGIPINGGGTGVGLDMHAHKDRLLSLNAFGESQTVSFSTDGATWLAPTTNITSLLLANVVTTHEDIDAGLMETVGNEAVAVSWDEDAGTITFFSSTDAGTKWTDEITQIASGNGPQGVAVMNGIDNAQKLYVGTREGLYEVDTSPSTWTADLIFPMIPNSDNCRRMAVGQNGALWFAQGVDDDSVPIVYNMFTANGTREFVVVPNDFSEGDGLPAARLGPIRRFVPAQGMMYADSGGGKEGRHAGIFAHNGGGWHSMRKHGTENQKIEWMAASGDDDGTPRLHYSVRTGAAVSNTKFLAQPFVNPVTGVAVNREQTGFIDMPYVDAGILSGGTWAQVRVNAEDLSATNSNEFINVDFGEDDGSGGLNARGNTDLGDFLSGTPFLNFASGAGISSVNMGLRINLTRDSGNNTDTPKGKDVQLIVKKNPVNTQGFVFMIDLERSAELQETTTEAVIATIETARDLGTFPTFQYGNMASTFVTILPIDWGDDIVTVGDSDAESVPDTNARRTGTVIITVEEPI